MSSTVSNNSANSLGGGLVAWRRDANAPYDPATITNSIIANSLNGEDCVINVTGLVTAGPTSIIEDGTCNTTALAIDPSLGGLDNNGGPTLTHLPIGDSPAINAADNADCGPGKSIAVDQRGLGRNDGACDIGAVEVQSTTAVGDGGGGSALNPALLWLALLIRILRGYGQRQESPPRHIE